MKPNSWEQASMAPTMKKRDFRGVSISSCWTRPVLYPAQNILGTGGGSLNASSPDQALWIQTQVTKRPAGSGLWEYTQISAPSTGLYERCHGG